MGRCSEKYKVSITHHHRPTTTIPSSPSLFLIFLFSTLLSTLSTSLDEENSAHEKLLSEAVESLDALANTGSEIFTANCNEIMRNDMENTKILSQQYYVILTGMHNTNSSFFADLKMAPFFYSIITFLQS